MKSALPSQAKLSKESKVCIQECVSEFISFITSQAADRCILEKRKTLNGEDILYALYTLGFENYSETLKIYLAKYRQYEQQLAESKPQRRRRRKKSAKADDDDEDDDQIDENEDDVQYSYGSEELLSEDISPGTGSDIPKHRDSNIKGISGSVGDEDFKYDFNDSSAFLNQPSLGQRANSLNYMVLPGGDKFGSTSSDSVRRQSNVRSSELDGGLPNIEDFVTRME